MTANAEQVRYWNEEGGTQWVARQDRLDRLLGVFLPPLLAAVAAAPGDHVLDIGSGSGATTLELAEAVGPDGRVMAVDVSRPLLDRLRARAVARGLGNVIVREADAQVAKLPPAHFDALASRFGVMFFDDPEAAFANLAPAVKPDGRLAFVCWQPVAMSPWFAEPLDAVLSVVAHAALPPPGSPGPFAFGEPERVRALLEGSGFIGVAIEPVVVELDGGTADEAADLALSTGMVARLTIDAGDAVREAAATAVREAMERNRAPDGRVRMAAAAWLVTARVP